jgi:hypothetical protein
MTILFSDEPKEENKANKEPAKNPADEKSADKKPADAAPADEKPPAKSTDEKAADDKTKPADQATPPALKIPASPPLPVSEELLLPMTIKEGPDPKYSPLWKVEKDIRKKLAEQRVSEKVRKSFDTIREDMATFLAARTRWTFDSKAHSEPKPLDYEGLAKQYELTFHKTPLIDDFQFSKIPDLGGAMDGTNRLVAVVFGVLPEYQARAAQDTKGNQFLVWKIEDKPSRVPELSDKDIHEEVVHTWKMIKARDLAVKKAEDLAKQAITAKQSLTDLFGKQANMKVTETNDFSWMTTGTAGGFDFNRQTQPTMSEVQGVDEPGDAFMKKVSEMTVGDVSVALNQPETIAYVIRVTKVDPFESVLKTRFLSQSFAMYQSVATPEMIKQQRAWLDHILKDIDFQFEGNFGASADSDDF